MAKDINNMDPPIQNGTAILHPFAHGARLSCLYKKGNGYGEGIEPWGAMNEIKEDVKGFRYAFAYTPVVHHTDTLPYTRKLELIGEHPNNAEFSMTKYEDVYSQQPNKIRWTFDMSGIHVVSGQQVLTGRQDKKIKNLAEQLKADVLRSTLEKSLDALAADMTVADGTTNPWTQKQKDDLAAAQTDLTSQQKKLATPLDAVNNISKRINDPANVSNDDAFALVTKGKAVADVVKAANTIESIMGKMGDTSAATKALVSKNQKDISSLTTDATADSNGIKVIELKDNLGVSGFFVSYINEYDSKNALDDTFVEGTTAAATLGHFNWGVRDTLPHTFFKDQEGDCGYLLVLSGSVSKIPAPPDMSKANSTQLAAAALKAAEDTLAKANGAILDADAAVKNAEKDRIDTVPLAQAISQFGTISDGPFPGKQTAYDAAFAVYRAAQAKNEDLDKTISILSKTATDARSAAFAATTAVALAKNVVIKIVPCPTVLENKDKVVSECVGKTTVYDKDGWKTTVVDSSSGATGTSDDTQTTTRVDSSTGISYIEKRTVDSAGEVTVEKTHKLKDGTVVDGWPVEQMSEADYAKTSYNMKDISDQCMFATQLIVRRHPKAKEPNRSDNVGIALTYDEISLYGFPTGVNECVSSYAFLYFSVNSNSPFTGLNLSKIDKKYYQDLTFQYKVENPYKSIFGKNITDNNTILKLTASSSTPIILTKWVLEINVYVECPSNLMLLLFRGVSAHGEGEPIPLANPVIFGNMVLPQNAAAQADAQAAKDAALAQKSAQSTLDAEKANLSALETVRASMAPGSSGVALIDAKIVDQKVLIATVTGSVATATTASTAATAKSVANPVITAKPYAYETWETFYLKRACWGYHFFRRTEDILCFGYDGSIHCYPTLEDYEGLTSEKLDASLENSNRDHNSLFEDDYNYAYYKTNEPAKWTPEASHAAVANIDRLYRTTDIHKKPYTLFTPHISSHNTMTFLFSDSQDISNFPITLKAGTKATTLINGTQAHVLALPGMYPIKITAITEEPKNDSANIFKELIYFHNYDKYQADYPSDPNAARKGISPYMAGYFNYDKKAVNTLLGTVRKEDGINEFMGSSNLTSNYVSLTKEIKKDTTIYVTGTIARNRYLRQVVQTHTRFSNDRLRMYKEYIWGDHEGNANFGKPGTDWDLYNCVKPKSLVETFNFVVACHPMENGDWEEKWRISELLTNARWIHRRWLKQIPVGDAPVLTPGAGKRFCWAADTRGIVMLSLNFNGKFSASVVLSRDQIKDKEWFQAYLDANNLNNIKLEDKLYVGLVDDLEYSTDKDKWKGIRAFSEIFTSGMLFDVSDTVNANVQDNKKMPYLRCFALAINLIKKGNKIGIKPLDLLQELQGSPGEDLDLADCSFAPGGVTAMRRVKEGNVPIVNQFNNADTTFYDFQCYQSYLSGLFRNAAIFKIPSDIQEELRQKMINNPNSGIKTEWFNKIGKYALVDPGYASANAAALAAEAKAAADCSAAQVANDAAEAAWEEAFFGDSEDPDSDPAYLAAQETYISLQDICNNSNAEAVALRAACPPEVMYRKYWDDNILPVDDADKSTWPCLSHVDPCPFFEGTDIPPGNHVIDYTLRDIDPTDDPMRDLVPLFTPDWVAPLATYYKAVPPCSPIKVMYSSGPANMHHLGGPMGAIVESEAEEFKRKGVPLTYVTYPPGYPFFGNGVAKTPYLTTLEQLYEDYYNEEEVVMPDVTLHPEPIIMDDTVQDNFTGVKWVTLSNTIFIPSSGNLRAFVESFGIERSYDPSIKTFEYDVSYGPCLNIFTKDQAIEYLAFELISDNAIVVNGSGIYTAQTPRSDNSFIVATDWAYNSVRCHEIQHKMNAGEGTYESWKVPHRGFLTDAAGWNTGLTKNGMYDIWKDMVSDAGWIKHEKDSLSPKYAKISGSSTSGELFSVFDNPNQCTDAAGKAAGSEDTLTQIKPSFISPSPDLTEDATNPNPILEPSDDPDAVRIDDIIEEQYAWKRGRAITCQNGLIGKSSSNTDANILLPLNFVLGASTTKSAGQSYRYLLTKEEYQKLIGARAGDCSDYPWVYMSSLMFDFTLANLEPTKLIVCTLGSGTERILTVVDLVELLPYANAETKAGKMVIDTRDADFGLIALYGDVKNVVITNARATVMTEGDFYKYKLFNQNALRWRHKKTTTTVIPAVPATATTPSIPEKTTTTEVNQILVSPRDDDADVIDKIRLVCGKFNNTILKDMRPTVDNPQFWPFPSEIKKSTYQGTTRRYALAYGTPIYDSKGRLFVFFSNTRNNISAMMSVDGGNTWYLHDGLIRLTEEEIASSPFVAFNSLTDIVSLFYLYKSQKSSAELLCVKYIDISLFQIVDSFVPYWPVEKIEDFKEEKDFIKSIDEKGKKTYAYSGYGMALRNTISVIIEGNLGKDITECGSSAGQIQGGWGWSKIAYKILSSGWNFYEGDYSSKYAQLPKDITDYQKIVDAGGVIRFVLGMKQDEYIRDIRRARYGAYMDAKGIQKVFIVWDAQNEKVSGSQTTPSGLQSVNDRNSSSKMIIKKSNNKYDWSSFPEDFIPHRIDNTSADALAASQLSLEKLIAARDALAAIKPNSPDLKKMDDAIIAAKKAIEDGKKYTTSDFTDWYFLNAFLCLATNKWGEVCACIPRGRRGKEPYIAEIICEPSSQGKTSLGSLDPVTDKSLITLCGTSSIRFGDLESISIAYHPLTDALSLFFGYTKTISVRKMDNKMIDMCIDGWKDGEGTDNTNIKNIIKDNFNLTADSTNKPIYIDGKLTDETNELSNTDPLNPAKKKTVRDVLEASKYIIYADHGNPSVGVAAVAPPAGATSGGTPAVVSTAGVRSWLRVGAYYNRAGVIRLFLFNEDLDILEVSIGSDLRVIRLRQENPTP